jgi:hypothetical protein
MLEFVNARMGSDHTIVVRSSVFRRESVTKLFLPSFWLNIQNNGLPFRGGVWHNNSCYEKHISEQLSSTYEPWTAKRSGAFCHVSVLNSKLSNETPA